MFLPFYLHIIVFTFLNLDAVQLVTTIFKNLLAKQWLEYGLKEEYPFNIYCNLCRRALKFHKILFVVSAVDLTDFRKFCNDFLMSNIAIIKIELANPGITQTIRDKRFNFESQLSGLGEFYLTDLF